ncbi:MAG: hypothetical protein Q4C74_02570 [Rothia sp. (in: high G+C Gram-positive bacteria)]|nr:hypothetical protein [Rothia sp. (in: high G+C Gram-positive bacteria)]
MTTVGKELLALGAGATLALGLSPAAFASETLSPPTSYRQSNQVTSAEAQIEQALIKAANYGLAASTIVRALGPAFISTAGKTIGVLSLLQQTSDRPPLPVVDIYSSLRFEF